MVTTHPSVGIVIYNRDDNAILIVRQFRPPVYVALQQEVRGFHAHTRGDMQLQVTLCTNTLNSTIEP